jgi:hypothetical protein
LLHERGLAAIRMGWTYPERYTDTSNELHGQVEALRKRSRHRRRYQKPLSCAPEPNLRP